MIYKGYTIEPETDPWALKYGNKYRLGEGDSLKSFSDLDEAKDAIDESIMKESPPWFVETQGPEPVAGIENLGQLHITKFTWLSDALKFSYQFNGKLTVQFNCP